MYFFYMIKCLFICIDSQIHITIRITLISIMHNDFSSQQVRKLMQLLKYYPLIRIEHKFALSRQTSSGVIDFKYLLFQ